MAEPRSGIRGTTGVLAILGHPVGHSRSPQIHNAAFAAQGLDLVYVAHDVPPALLPPAVAGLRALGVRGANITVPHKQAVIPLLDDVDDLARRVGAVNTIVNRDSRLWGTNTDVSGFLGAVEHAWGRSPSGARCLVLGAGGAGRAVVAALVGAGADRVYLYNRTPERALDLCRAAAGWGAVPCRTVSLEEAVQLGPEVELIVNATSVGLGEGVKETPIPVDMVTRRHLVMDLVYGAEPTSLVAAARKRGAIGLDGREMLVRQAAAAYELWTGRKAPIDVMRDQVMRG